MKYKVVILSAGIGSRMGKVTDHINKAILPINNKAVISHIIEKFPKEIEIVIAVGHKKETIKDYLSIACPERKITYVEIDKFIGPGTGPGYSLLQCKKHLDCPFIFSTSDTIVLEEIPEPNENWFGINPIKETERYLTVKIKNNLIIQLDDKIKCDNKYAFIGLAGIKDFEAFFNALEKNKEQKSGEMQVSNGFNSLIEKQLIPQPFTWFDTGTEKNYRLTNESFSGGKFDFSKTDEFIYFVNGMVIKYHKNSEIIKKKVERAKNLKGLVPEIEKHIGNFFSYEKIEGQVLYDILDRQVVRDFLYWIKKDLWKKKETSQEFVDACKKFYLDKTKDRLKKFYEKTGVNDTENIINGVLVPKLDDLLKKINWNKLCLGIPSTFHGDLQFDNVIVSRKNNLNKFTLIDWRQEFAGLDFGDLYYDLAKLYGGLNISYKQIKNNEFKFDMSGNSIYFNFSIGNDLVDAKEEFEEFIKNNKFDLEKIKMLTALIYLNMSPLHSDPFDLMIYYFGKLKLYQALK